MEQNGDIQDRVKAALNDLTRVAVEGAATAAYETSVALLVGIAELAETQAAAVGGIEEQAKLAGSEGGAAYAAGAKLAFGSIASTLREVLAQLEPGVTPA